MSKQLILIPQFFKSYVMIGHNEKQYEMRLQKWWIDFKHLQFHRCIPNSETALILQDITSM